MNAHAQTLKPVELGTNYHEVEKLGRAIEITLIRYRAIPNYGEDNQRLKAEYWRTYQGLCAEMMEALHG